MPLAKNAEICCDVLARTFQTPLHFVEAHMAEMSGTPQSQGWQRESNGRDGGLASKVRDTANAQLTNQKNRATDGLGSVAQAVRQTTQQLRNDHHDTLAGYVEQAANQMERLSERLRNKDVAELMRDAQRLAKSQPLLFVGGAFAVGLLAARFFKSSAEAQGANDWSQRPWRADEWGQGGQRGMRDSGMNTEGGFGTTTEGNRSNRMYGPATSQQGSGTGTSAGASQPGTPSMSSTQSGRENAGTQSDAAGKGTGTTARTRRGAQTERS
jgi:hypothetical protein